MRKLPLPDENRKHAERLCENETSLRKTSVEEGEIFFDDSEEGSSTDGNELIKKSAKKSAREYAMLLVSTHTYTEKALTEKIKSKKIYSDTDISEAVEYVKGFGYVNDKRLAENSLQRLAECGYGRMKICRYLQSKGISEDIIESLDFSEIDFVYYCKRLMEKQAGKPHEKVMRALLNAGYTYDEIAEAKREQD